MGNGIKLEIAKILRRNSTSKLTIVDQTQINVLRSYLTHDPTLRVNYANQCDEDHNRSRFLLNEYYY